MTRPRGGPLHLLAVAVALAGCYPLAQRHYPTNVSTAIRRDAMRRMESPDLVVYYPEGRRAEAERFQGWVGGCLQSLYQRVRIQNSLSRRKPFAILIGAPLDNAFVMPPLLGLETASV